MPNGPDPHVAYPGQIFSNELEVIARAMQVRGGVAGPFNIRSESGLYLQADVVPLVNLRDTQVRRLEVSITAPSEVTRIESLRLPRTCVVAAVQAWANPATDGNQWNGGVIRAIETESSDLVNAATIHRIVVTEPPVEIDSRHWFPASSAQEFSYLPWLVKAGQVLRFAATRATGSAGTLTWNWELLLYEARTDGLHPVSR